MGLGMIMLVMKYVLRWVICGTEAIVRAGETGEIEGWCVVCVMKVFWRVDRGSSNLC